MSKNVNYTQDVNAQVVFKNKRSNGYSHWVQGKIITSPILKSKPETVKITLNVKNLDKIGFSYDNGSRLARITSSVCGGVYGYGGGIRGHTLYKWKNSTSGHIIHITGKLKIIDEFKRVRGIKGKSFPLVIPHDIINKVTRVQLNANGDIYSPKTSFKIYGALSYYKAGDGIKSIFLHKVEFDVDQKKIISIDTDGKRSELDFVNRDEILIYVADRMTELLMNKKK